MRKVNSLVICKKDYESQYEFEEAIKRAVMLLLGAKYVMTVRYDDKSLGIVIIEYDYADLSFGTPYPYWLLPEEEESVNYESNND